MGAGARTSSRSTTRWATTLHRGRRRLAPAAAATPSGSARSATGTRASAATESSRCTGRGAARSLLRIWNPDGSEAEKSGNSVRGSSRASSGTSATRARRARDRDRRRDRCARGSSCAAGRCARSASTWGGPRSAAPTCRCCGPPREVVDEPLRVGSVDLRVTCVSIGEPALRPLRPECCSPRCCAASGRSSETHPIFPKRTQRAARASVRSRSGSTIADLGARRRRDARVGQLELRGRRGGASPRAGRPARSAVHMPGGALRIEIGADYSLRMTGPATPVYRAALADSRDSADWLRPRAAARAASALGDRRRFARRAASSRDADRSGRARMRKRAPVETAQPAASERRGDARPRRPPAPSVHARAAEARDARGARASPSSA